MSDELYRLLVERGYPQHEAHAIASMSPRSSSGAEVKQWRCFHCSETFTDATAAAEHFGPSMASIPGCQIDLAEYRRMEQLHERNLAEDTDKDRAYYRLQSEMQTAVRRAEEAGYAKGLKDAGYSGEPRVKHFAQAPHVAIPAGGPRPMTSRANAYVKGIREGVDPVELVRGMLNYQIWLEGQHIQALERLSGEPGGGRWISVKDRLPLDYMPVLVWDGMDFWPAVYQVHDGGTNGRKAGNWYENSDGFAMRDITHWMAPGKPLTKDGQHE